MAGSSARIAVAPRNRLLAALPPAALLKLRADLVPTRLVPGRVLLQPDEPIARIYFIGSGAVLLAASFQSGGAPEMATVGREGMVGISALLGGRAAIGRYVVQAAGSALALETGRFQAALREILVFRVTCQAYARAFLAQAFQTAACNSVHTVEQRCARWLLMSHDRSDGEAFTLTQELLAQMLGLCRSTVTVAARAFQEAGLIRYSRGGLTVLDRRRLEAASCECYLAIREHFEQLLPRTYERPLETAQERVAARSPERAVPYVCW